MRGKPTRQQPGHSEAGVPVLIQASDVLLEGNLAIPEPSQGLVVFAHGSGSSRFSSRNRYVAEALRRAGMGTLLFDLLTAEEEAFDAITGRLRFDIDLLARRIVATTAWLAEHEATRELSIGYFGASTGGGAALVAAAALPDRVRAVVSRGGRPDLAGEALRRVQAPTLLIVGGLDDVVLELNRQALAQLTCEKQLQVIPGASHLFEEPGTLEAVARQAAAWFKRYLTPQAH